MRVGNKRKFLKKNLNCSNISRISISYSVCLLLILFFIMSLSPALVAQSTYYSRNPDANPVNFSVLTNWNTLRTGGPGSNPSDLVSGDNFVIQDGHTITLDISTAQILSLTIENISTPGIFDNSTNTLQIGENGGSGGLLDIQGTYTATTGKISFFKAGFGTPAYTIQSSNSAETFNNITFSDGSLSLTGTSATFTINGTLKIGSEAGAVSAVTGGVTLNYGDDSIIEYAPGADYNVDEEWSSSIVAASVSINSSGNTISVPSGSRTIGKTLTLTAGTLSMSINNSLTVLGDISSSDIAGSGSVTTSGTGIISMGNGGSSQFLQNITGSMTLSNLTINKAAAINDVSVTGNPTILNGLTLTAGDLVIDGGSITINSGDYTQSAGTTNIINSGSFTVTSGDLIVNGGAFSNTNGSITVTNGANSISVASGATFAMTTGANSISVDEIILAGGATYKTGGKSITNLTTLTLDPNSTFEFDGLSAVETTPLSNPIFGNVTLSNASGLNINGTVRINKILNFNAAGTVNTGGANTLTLESTATITNAASDRFVKGPLRRTYASTGAFTYPVGSGSESRNATLNITAGTFGINDSVTITISHSTASFSQGTLPTGISAITQTSHYIVASSAGYPGDGAYSFKGTFEDGNFSPESRNRVLVQDSATPTWIVGSTTLPGDVDGGLNTVLGSGFSDLPKNNGWIAFGAGGTTVTWTGDEDDDWHTGSNWSTSSVPTSVDDVTIDRGGGVVVHISDPNEAVSSSLVIGNVSGTNTVELSLESSAADPLTVGGALTVHDNAKLTVVDNTNPFSAGSTIFNSGSTVEYQDGNIPVDNYDNLNINGASGTTGSGTINVAGDLVKTGGNFTGVNTFDVTGVYTNTAGDATFNGGGLIVDGTPFTVTSGVVGGTIDINSITTTVTGATGSFGGTVTFSHTAAQSVGGTGTIVFSTLKVDNSNGLSLNLPTTATSLILTNGLINNGSNVLTLGSGSSGSATSYVNGPVAITNATTSQTFPIGKSSYRPVTTNLSSAASPTVQFEVFDLAPNYSFSLPLVHISTVRYWLGTLTGTITGGTINLNYGPDDGVQTTGSLLMAYSVDNSAAYTSLGGTGSGAPSGNISGSLSGTALGYFTLGTSAFDNSLPVELRVFSAQPDYNMVTLTWATESELQNQGFNIYRRSKNETADWKLLTASMIPGQGSTSEKTDYEYVDRSVAAGHTYEYMLESVSYSGVRVQEKIIEVLIPVPTEYAVLGNYPNPFNPTTQIGFRLPESSDISIVIYGVRGNVVKELALNRAFDAGDHYLTWDGTDNNGQNIASGMYIYLFTAGKFKQTAKMLLIK
jgi:hypothetical protein